MPVDREMLGRQGMALAPLLDYLRSIGYTLPNIANLVQEKDPANFLTNAGFCAFVYEEDCKRDGSPLALFARMFLMGGRVEARSYRSAIPAKIRELLELEKLVRPTEDDCVSAEVAIVEFESFYLLSDKLFDNYGDGNIEVYTASDAVWPMSEWSLNLYRAFKRNPRWTTMLDVGCGSGCLALLANRRYSRCLGIDLNPRAVAFSKLNAALNRVNGVDYEIADCFEFGKGKSARYDHVVFAAPGGPSGNSGDAPMVSHGGQLGHEMVLRFLGERVEDLLSPQGCCQIWGIFAVHERYGSIEELVEESLPANRFSLLVEPLRSGGLYLSPQHIRTARVPPGCHYARGEKGVRLLHDLQKSRVKEVTSAVVTLQFKQAEST